MRIGRWVIFSMFSLSLCGCTTQGRLEPSQAEPPSAAVAHANVLAGTTGAYRDRYWGSGDQTIHYVEAGPIAGNASTVVFIHGFPSFWYVWRDQMEWMRKCRRVIAIDALGANLSGKPASTDAYSVANLSRQLHAFLADVAPGEKVTLVGHDWGGALAWSYTEWKADRVDRLVVFSAPPYDLILDLLVSDPQQRQRSDYMLRLIATERDDVDDAYAERLAAFGYGRMVESGKLTPEEGELFRQALSVPGAAFGGIQWYRANVVPFDAIDLSSMAFPHPEAKADVPVLLVRGAEDRVFVERMGEAARNHAKSLEIVTLSGVGHNTPFEDPKEARAALAGFMGLSDDCERAPAKADH